MTKIFLVGYMGSGKSTAGKKLASKLNFDFVDMDKFIEAEYGMSIEEIFSKKGQSEFRAMEHNALKKLLTVSKNTVISCGGGTPCYYNNMELMNNNGITIYLKMSADSLANRLINAKDHRPLIDGKTHDELKKYITEHLEKREDFYHKAQFTVKGKDLNLDELASYVAKEVNP
ncbi:MAG: shikimate kinase [Bacteroidetes bacterium]|nr:shikimate kinase [Bacteroidota bacterium]